MNTGTYRKRKIHVQDPKKENRTICGLRLNRAFVRKDELFRLYDGETENLCRGCYPRD